MSVSVLLCGMGGYGENYVKEYLSHPTIEDSRLVAIADPFAEKSPLYGQVKEQGIALYPSPDAFFAQGHADLVVISSPIHTHYPYIMEALHHGCYVLTEKPVCFNLEQIDEMIEESRKQERFVAVGYQLCYSPDVLALKKDILSGLYGRCRRMRTLRLMRRDDIYYHRNAWAGRLSCHGEVVLDSPFCNACAHQAQNELFLLGKAMDETAKVAKVEGVIARIRPSIENYDTAALVMTTEEGVPCYYYTSHAVDEKRVGPISTFEFEKATIEEADHGFVAKAADGTVIKDYRDMDKGQRMEKLSEVVRCITEGREPVCTLKTSREHTRAVLMAQDLGVTDLSASAVRRQDEAESDYYTIPSLTRLLEDSYAHWTLPRDIAKLDWSETRSQGGLER